MNSLSWEIEQYIKGQMEQAHSDVLEIQRSMLSQLFNCVPSQINYVLSTRFTPAQGYLVESRRGGGGFVRIVCLTFAGDEDLKQVLTETIGEEISQNEAEGLLESLLSQGYLEDRESLILKTMLKDRVIGGEKKSRDTLRANLLKHALSAICQ